MATLANTLTILSAMFTPAVLVSACASLILTTSQRLELVRSSATWIVAGLSVLGASLLLYASLLLIKESRLAVADVAEETAYLTTAA